jgi:hypothetical protein
VPKVVGTDFGTGSKIFKAKNTIIKTFNLVPKKNLQLFALDQKFLKPRINTIIRTFNLLPKKNLQLFSLDQKS